MIVTAFSVTMSLIWFSLAALLSSFLLRRTGRSWQAILVLALGLIRLLVPVELLSGKIISSWHLYPWIRSVLRSELFPGFRVSPLLLGLWALGSVVCLVILVIRLFLLYRLCTRAVPLPREDPAAKIYRETALEMGLPTPPPLAVSGAFSTPVSAGLFKPQVLLPAQFREYSSQELRYVFRHELAHHIRKDLWSRQGIALLRCLFWWNPCMWLLCKTLEQAQELNCDQLACAPLDKRQRTSYLQTILHTLGFQAPDCSNLPVALKGIPRRNYLRQRFQAVLCPKKPLRKGVASLIVCLCLAGFLLSYTVILQPARLPSQEELDAQGAEIGSKELISVPFILCESGTYFIVENGIVRGILSESDLSKPEYADLEIVYAQGH